MKSAATIVAILIATPALADPGHFAAEHGHSHWLAAGTLALAAIIGGVALWRARGMRRSKKAERKA